MPYTKTSSCLKHNLAAQFEICKMMFKSSLTTSLIAGILSVPSLGIAQATTSTEEKTANNRSLRAVSKINPNAKNQSKTTLPKNSHSFSSVKTLTANLSSLPSTKKHSVNASISNQTDVRLGSTPIESKTANFDSGFNLILANQNLATTPESSTTTEAAKPTRVHIVSRGDTISKIARRYGVSKDDVVRLNQLNNSNVIFVSQRLEIPTTDNSAPTEAVPNIPQQSDRVTSFTPTKVVNKERHKAARPLKLNRDRYIANDTNQLRVETNDLPNQQLAQIQTVSVATSVPLSNSQQNLLPKDSIALQLPPLPPDEYLPSAFDGYIWPAQGILTSGYGWRWGRMHRGIDIAAPIGTPIVAAAAGEVIIVGWQRGYGNVIKLKHLDGSVTVYGHNHKNLVIHGQKVEQGEQIAEMGNTGRSTGPHVHFEIRSADKVAIDPLAFLGKR